MEVLESKKSIKIGLPREILDFDLNPLLHAPTSHHLGISLVSLFYYLFQYIEFPKNSNDHLSVAYDPRDVKGALRGRMIFFSKKSA